MFQLSCTLIRHYVDRFLSLDCDKWYIKGGMQSAEMERPDARWLLMWRLAST